MNGSELTWGALDRSCLITNNIPDDPSRWFLSSEAPERWLVTETTQILREENEQKSSLSFRGTELTATTFTYKHYYMLQIKEIITGNSKYNVCVLF